MVFMVIVLFMLGEGDVTCSGDADGRDSNVAEGGAVVEVKVAIVRV